jgi:cytochrome c oxidase assembly protein subunit 15
MMSMQDPRELIPATAAPYQHGPFWIALFATVFTLPLLFVGGSVTTYRVGLAVPDWPTTFGENMFVYDFWNAPFGVRIEHAHRLYGAAVGLATLILAGWFLAFERRVWIKWLGVLAVVAVIVQGVLGGTRVTEASTMLAAVHGFMGQAFFGLLVILCVVTGRSWSKSEPAVVDSERLRTRALVNLGLVAAQIAAGSWLRHYGSRSALVVHGLLGLAVWTHVLFFAWRVERRHTSFKPLAPSARVAAATSTLQIVLGIVALFYLWPFDGIPKPVTFYQAVVRTCHQTNSALLLAATIVATLRTFRHLAGPATSRSPDFGAGLDRPLEPAKMDWEAVA